MESFDLVVIGSGPGGQKVWVAFGRTAFHPFSYEGYFLLRETDVVLKVAEALDASPGWHAALQDFFLDCLCPGAGLLVGGE